MMTINNRIERNDSGKCLVVLVTNYGPDQGYLAFTSMSKLLKKTDVPDRN